MSVSTIDRPAAPTPAWVRVVDTSSTQAVVCRRDQLAESIRDSFTNPGPSILGALAELQARLGSGKPTAELEARLCLTISPAVTASAAANDYARDPDAPNRIPALPAGAVNIYEWEAPARTGYPHASRAFVGTERIVNGQYTGDIMVRIEGTQHADGRVERRVLVHEIHADFPLTAAEARRLGCALIAAADEVERQPDISEVITYRDACKAGVAVVCADADKFGATL